MSWQTRLSVEIRNSHTGEPLYAVIVRFLRERIVSGELAEGVRLPTNRELSKLLDVDRSTVSRAYGELMKLGLIDSRVGRGSYVRSAGSYPSSFVADEKFSWADSFSKSSRIVSELFQKQPPPAVSPETISFAGGLPTEEFYPSTELQTVVQDIVANPQAADLFAYSPAEGHVLLRNQVMRHLFEQGISASDDELLIVSGSQQAIDLVADVLLDPGDAVLLENPSYFWAICNLRMHQARCIPVPVNSDGIDLDELEREIVRVRPKLLYVMPSFQNPTGALVSVDNRVRLVDLACHYGVPILEDNFVGDLRYDGPPLPPLRALPGAGDIVIHQGTFSKALCPGLRLGWIVAPREVHSRLLLAKRVSDLSTNSMAQLTLAKYLSMGLYEQHLEKVRAAYKNRRDAMLFALDREFADLHPGPSWSRPEGGLFIWMQLPDRLSARDFLRFAEQEGVSFSLGQLFFVEPEQDRFVRLCFIQSSEESIRSGVQRLAQAYKRYLPTVIDSGAHNPGASRIAPEHVLI